MMEPTELQQALSQPFPPESIRQKPGPGGRMLDYVPWALVARRWNELIPEWSFTVDRLTHEGHYWLAQVTVDAPGLGKRTNVGSAVGDHEDVAKSAVSDALKRCLALFGLGLHLWTDPEEEVQPGPTEARQPGPKPRAQPRHEGNGGEGITPNQAKAIRGIAERRGLANEDLLETLQASFSTEDLNHLTKAQASDLIAWLQHPPSQAQN